MKCYNYDHVFLTAKNSFPRGLIYKCLFGCDFLFPIMKLIICRKYFSCFAKVWITISQQGRKNITILYCKVYMPPWFWISRLRWESMALRYLYSRILINVSEQIGYELSIIYATIHLNSQLILSHPFGFYFIAAFITSFLFRLIDLISARNSLMSTNTCCWNEFKAAWIKNDI